MAGTDHLQSAARPAVPGRAGDTAPPARLLNDRALERSPVAANCAMNRERQLAGVNSYARELGFSPLDVLRDSERDAAARGAVQPGASCPAAAWLDLCCGTGRALIQAATRLYQDGLADRTVLVGVDLVDAFDPVPAEIPNLRLMCSSVTALEPAISFDLITCVHGLHYVGDKLATLARAASWLTPGGRLVADLDLTAIVVPGGRQAARELRRRLAEAGLGYEARRHRITCTGQREVLLPYRYLGADDQAGPGYTGQPAVASYYEQV
jgi:SAM-dependent methyltransferase